MNKEENCFRNKRRTIILSATSHSGGFTGKDDPRSKISCKGINGENPEDLEKMALPPLYSGHIQKVAATNITYVTVKYWMQQAAKYGTEHRNWETNSGTNRAQIMTTRSKSSKQWHQL